MAKTSSGDGGGECSTTIDMPAGADAAHTAGTDEVPPQSLPERRKRHKKLSNIVFSIVLLEWAGHAVGTLAFIWATVVMLGGFSTMLSRIDFWFSTIMVFMEGTRVFVRSDASVSQWLFGSTRAFRWDDFSYPRVPKYGIEAAMFIGVGISFVPLDHFRPEIAAGILKVALLVFFSKLLTARGRYVLPVLVACMGVGFYGPLYSWYKMLTPHKPTSKRASMHAFAKAFGVFLGWWFALAFVGGFVAGMGRALQSKGRTMVCCLKVMVASALACLPFLQGKLGSRYRFIIIPIAVALHSLSCPLPFAQVIDLPRRFPYLPRRFPAAAAATFSDTTGEQNNNALLLPTSELVARILDRLMPMLFFWCMVSPFPGISLNISSYILFSLLAVALVGNLQIPVAFLQVLLSGMRLQSLLGHHHHRAYDPLPDGATINLVPSIVVFYVLELCQGSAYILGIVLGIVSFRRRRSLARALGLFTYEWGAKAVNLYQHHIYEARLAKGLFPKEKYRPPSLSMFAIESLGSTSSQMDIVRVHVLHHYLLHQHHQGAEKEKLVTEMAKDANKGITTKAIGIISSLVADLSDNSTSADNTAQENTRGCRWSCSTKKIHSGEQKKVIVSSLHISVTFVRELATTSGKIGSRFRQELWENAPLLLKSAQSIFDLEYTSDESKELLEAMIKIVATLALDGDTRQEIGSNQAIIATLVGAFLSNKDLQTAAGKALDNLTTMSTENCWAILNAGPRPSAGHLLIKDLVTMLHKEDTHIRIIAANLLRNLCANSGDMLIHDYRAEEDLKSALKKVMETIKTTDTEEGGKLLEATLSAASQIGYVINPKDFANELDENLGTTLVDTLRSNGRPCPECRPRIRRALIELVISIVSQCPDSYASIFRNLSVKDTLVMVKRTSSFRLEKYMLLVGDEGMVLESTPLRCLLDEAIKLVEAAPTQGAQPDNHEKATPTQEGSTRQP